MKLILKFPALLMIVLCSSLLPAQEKLADPWITYPTANITEYGVYHFRKAFLTDEIPQKLIIHISADNRYTLFVNGNRVCYGPAKGDFKTYKYDIVDIAAFLLHVKLLLKLSFIVQERTNPCHYYILKNHFHIPANNRHFSLKNVHLY